MDLTQPSPNLTILLNKAQAVIASGHARASELADHLKREAPRVSEWLNRRHIPSGDVVFGINDWTGKMLNQIAVSNDHDLQARLREAYKRIAKKNA